MNDGSCSARCPGAVLGLSTMLTPSIARACHDTTVCLSWAGEFEDGPYGTYGVTSGVAAIGAHIVIIRPSPEPPLNGFLDDSGCITFQTEYEYGHKAVVYAEAVVGNVHIRPFIGSDDLGAVVDYHWEIDLQGLGPDSLAAGFITNDDVAMDPAVNPNDYVPLVPMMASATLALGRLPMIWRLLIPNVAEVDLVFNPAMGGAACHCGYVGDHDFVWVGPDSYKEKFGVAHNSATGCRHSGAAWTWGRETTTILEWMRHVSSA